jgi:hypothetical protein
MDMDGLLARIAGQLEEQIPHARSLQQLLSIARRSVPDHVEYLGPIAEYRDYQQGPWKEVVLSLPHEGFYHTIHAIYSDGHMKIWKEKESFTSS